MKAIVTGLVVIAGIGLFGCKKNKDKNANVDNDKRADSAMVFTRDIYLWYNQIPSSFNARQYADPNALMEAIRPFSIETGFSTPVDRFSFAMLKSEWDGISSGVSGDFGMNVFFLSADDLRVSYVERESPAGKAGIKRSWRMKQFNGNSNITTANADAIVKAVYQSNSGTFVFARPTGSDTTITLQAASYKEHPLLLDSVYTTGSTKTGYFVFNSFLGDTNEIKNEFVRVFNKFNTANVQDVIVDLRYNGGGYVSVQSLLANYLVPAAGNNGVMQTEQFNDKYTAINETTRYVKKGTMNLNRLFVIVSQNTASASELLINSLKPYMNVQLIGPSRTHGKPVGFFPIPVFDWYIFPVSFRTVNKNGEGNYFNGFSLNYQIMDGLDKPWGDTRENCLGSTLQFIQTGSYARAGVSLQRAGLSVEVHNSNSVLGSTKFKGSIDVKHDVRGRR
jgi:carboxyl-terminal processing protease